MRIGTFNILADSYLHYGDSLPSDPKLQAPGSRIEPLKQLIDTLDVSVLAVQEADKAFSSSVKQGSNWQVLWHPKGKNKPDGCLTLVRPGVSIDSYNAVEFSDGSGHVAQIIQLGNLALVNTHLKWSPADDPHHKGLGQARELLEHLGDQPAVILADCNDRPGGPVRQCLADAGFRDVVGNTPTAWVDGKAVSIDIIALRGVAGHLIPTSHVPARPHRDVPSDHIPLLAKVQPLNRLSDW